MQHEWRTRREAGVNLTADQLNAESAIFGSVTRPLWRQTRLLLLFNRGVVSQETRGGISLNTVYSELFFPRDGLWAVLDMPRCPASGNAVDQLQQDGNETDTEGDKWGSLPVDVLSRIIFLACEVPHNPDFHRNYTDALSANVRRFQGGLRLLNTQWCAAVDYSVTTLTPNWRILKPRKLYDLVQRKLCWVERVGFTPVAGGCMDKLKFGRVCTLYGTLPITELDFSRLPHAVHSRMDTEHLASLSSLRRLEFLNVSNCYHVVRDGALGWISNMLSLRRLDISSMHSDNFVGEGLGQLSSLTNLTRLDMMKCGCVEDEHVVGLSALTSLRHLDVHNCPQLTTRGLEFVSNLTNLTFLDYSGCWKGKSLEVLPGVAKLKRLKHLGCVVDVGEVFPVTEAISDLAVIKNLSVEHLKVHWNNRQFVDDGEIVFPELRMAYGLSHVLKMVTLRELDITCEIGHEDCWKALSELTQVTSLRFSEIQWGYLQSNLDRVAALTGLKQLSLHPQASSDLGNLDPLTNLVCLREFRLSMCITPEALDTITKLTSLHRLQVQLSVSDNKEELMRIGGMTWLKSLVLDGSLTFKGTSYRDYMVVGLNRLSGLFNAGLSCLSLICCEMGLSSSQGRSALDEVRKDHPDMHVVVAPF